jgi:hypothetical protein
MRDNPLHARHVMRQDTWYNTAHAGTGNRHQTLESNKEHWQWWLRTGRLDQNKRVPQQGWQGQATKWGAKVRD